jgi:hypothetical protein
MGEADDRELRELRERAYGRNPDLHLDPESWERLRLLESAQVRAGRVHEGENPVPADDAELEPVDDLPDEPGEPPESPARRLLVSGGRWLRGLRRSTVLIVLGVAAFTAALVTLLVLVQRVQSDPLQIGAQQVARLGVDTGYEVPLVFQGAFAADSGPEPHGFEPFHGLRAVLTRTNFLFADGGSMCLDLYPERNITTTTDSFQGPLFAGCAAGGFPAIVQFRVDMEGLPAEIVSAFPNATALQFVYDREHDEVVVFATDAP